MTAEFCAAPFHGGPEPAVTGAYLCRACRSILRRHLRALPGLDSDLAQATTGTDYGRGTNGAAPLPFSEAASAHRDHIKGLLVSWALLVAEERARPLPADEVPAIAEWLAAQCESGRHGYCAYRPWAGDMAAEISECHARAWEILAGPPRAIIDLPGSRCDACGARLRAVVYDVTDRRASFVGCPQCRARWDLDQDAAALRGLAGAVGP